MIHDDDREGLLSHDDRNINSSRKRYRAKKSLLERMGFRNSTTSDKCLGCFLLLCFVGPLLGVIPYLMFTKDTIALFAGMPSETANFWCSMIASGELCMAFVALMGLVSSRIETKQLALSTFTIYSISHFGLYLGWGLAHLSIVWNAFFFSSIGLSVVAMILWGIPISTQRPRLWM